MLNWTAYHTVLNMQIDPTYFYVLDNYFWKKYQNFEKSQHARSNIWMHFYNIFTAKIYHAICADMITLFKSKIVASYKDPQQY